MPPKHEKPTKQGAAPLRWTFLTNHARVVVCIAENPEVRLREVAAHVGITERAVQRIVADLEEGGYLTRSRDGRRNRYQIHANLPLRHALEAHCPLRLLLGLLGHRTERDSHPTERASRDSHADDGSARSSRSAKGRTNSP